ncbi:hypothetical protein [Actinoplanes sp. NPDC049316]|uniref:hypothetical protein n=1 Tax=Actinoplanes sp. NPDC049316 TaxID=3154727 RepID=UPI0034451E78
MPSAGGRRTEAVVQEEWTRHLGRRTTVRLHQILTRLREINRPVPMTGAEDQAAGPA